MESAPLTLAHTHARNAALETKRSNPVAASEEHDLAAAEFAAAAQGTKDVEAKRILVLLEHHHKRLGQLLKNRHEQPADEIDNAHIPASRPQASKEPIVTQLIGTTDTSLAEKIAIAKLQNPPRLAKPSRATARDLSSSIASNLASARGIPNRRKPEPVSPTVSAQYVGGKFALEEAGQRATAHQKPDKADRARFASSQMPRKPSWAPPSSVPDVENVADLHAEDEAAGPDTPFQQFYNTFESLITKISAPLAFAGLPLTSAPPQKYEPAPVQSPRPKSPKVSKTPTPALDASVDYSKLISRAALRAVRGGTNINPAESFYVVPTTGGTISYAEIMSRAERENNRGSHTRQASGLSEDDFFDAHTTAPSIESLEKPSTSGKKRGATLSRDTKTVAGKTMEELALENQALKHLSDTLSKRLHVFELSSQSSTAAMAQSIRSLQRSPMATPENSGRGGSGRGIPDEKTKTRISELEEILRKSDREVQRRREENAKLKDTVLRYREKWEKLKEGARARRDGVGGVDKDVGRAKGTESPNLGLGAPVEPEQESGRVEQNE